MASGGSASKTLNPKPPTARSAAQERGDGLGEEGFSSNESEGDVKDENRVVCSVEKKGGAGGNILGDGGEESAVLSQGQDMVELGDGDGRVAGREVDDTEGGEEAVGDGGVEGDDVLDADSAEGGDDMEVEALVEKENFPRYLRPPEDCKFAVSDMVWGKVRSHPWWPAQIFDPSDASEAAMKYKKRDGYLVAYFGDHSFAWNDVSMLKPYRTHFTRLAKQSSMPAFVNAVNCSLDEVSRRVEFGLVCYCTPDDVYDKIKSQHIDNAGIREGASVADSAYGSFNMTSFEPDKLVWYLKDLALCPTCGCDKLDLTIAKAQLLSFYRTKGYSELPNFSIHLAWPDNKADLSRPESMLVDVNIMENENPVSKEVKGQDTYSRKRKSSFSEDGFGSSKKQRSLADLADRKSSGSTKSSKNSHNVDFVSVGLGQTKKRKFVSVNDADNSPVNKKQFKVGERISRIANKLARTPLTGKNGHEKIEKNAKLDEKNHEGVAFDSPRTQEVCRRKAGNIVDYSSVNEMLSQLCLAARDPFKLYSFIPMVTDFFSDFRNEYCQDNSNSAKGTKKMSARKRGRKPIQSESASGGTLNSKGAKNSYSVKLIVHGSEKEAGKKLKSDPSLERDDDNLSHAKDGGVSQDEMLSQLCLAARDPLRLYSFIPVVTGFFSDFRNEYCQDNSNFMKESKNMSVRKRGRRPTKSESGSDGTSKSEGAKDSYCANPTVHGSEEEEEEKKSESDPSLEKDNDNLSHAKDGGVSQEEAFEEYSPTALILNFTEVDSLPSQIDLVKIFGQYGPLEESETEVMRETKRVKVIFKKKAHAEVALSSAGKFHIFGPALVSYRLSHLPSPSRSTQGCRLTDKKTENPVRSESPVTALTEDVNSQMDCGSKLLATVEKKLMSQLAENGGTKTECESELPCNDGSSQILELPGRTHLESGSELPTANIIYETSGSLVGCKSETPSADESSVTGQPCEESTVEVVLPCDRNGGQIPQPYKDGENPIPSRSQVSSSRGI